MDRKGANTFPFYKSISRTEKRSHKEFFCAFVLSMLEKIKDGGDSCFRDISRTSVKHSVPDPPITAAYVENELLVMHFFQDILTGAQLDWYMQLERTHVSTWGELANSFLKHYHYNTAMAPSRTQLQGMVQKSEDSFKEYAQRWRELAARVQPPLLDRELIDLFMGTLRGPYLQHMLRITSTYFSDKVIVVPQNFPSHIPQDMILVIGGSGTECLTLVREMSRKQESPPSFIFSNMDRTKAQQNSLLRMSLGSGGRFIEREGVSTLSIHGYPWALRYLLICVFKVFVFFSR